MKSILVILICIVLLSGVGLVSASYNFTNYSLQTAYSGGELVKGSINISFSNQENANFSDSFGGSVDLLTLVKTIGSDYKCIPDDCKDGYGSPNVVSKNFNIDGEELFAFATGGYNETSVTGLKFNVSSNYDESCSSQVYIDLLNDGNVDFYNPNFIDSACGAKNYGCFDSSLNSEQYNLIYIGASPKLCERITLPEAPAYRLGAKIKNGSSNVRLIMTLYDIGVSSSSERGHCQLPANTQDIQERDCIVNYSSYKGFESYVCLSADMSSGNTDFQIRAESNSSLTRCGTSFDNIGKSFPVDYEIYAFPLQFAPVENLRFDSNSFSKLNYGASLANTLADYVHARYGNPADCSNKCVIPFRIWGLNQDATLSDVVLSYSSPQLGGTTSDSNLYSISNTKFKINTGNLNLDLKDFAINVPYVNGTKSFQLKFNNDILISKQISISGGFSFDINPKTVAVGRNVEFSIDVNNITSSNWNFGDGSADVSSSTGKTVHKYSYSGQYEVSVKAVKVGGDSSTRTFKIYVGDAQTSANTTLFEYEKRLVNITNQIEAYPDWIKVELKKNIDLSKINDSLASIRVQYERASSDSDYEKVLTNLSNMNIPYAVYASSAGKDLPITIGFENIDLRYIQEIAQSQISDDSADKLKADLVAWINENYNTKISYETISETFSSGPEPILTKFKISLIPKIADNSDTNYLIIGVPLESIYFLESNSAKSLSEGAGTYIDFIGSKEVEFYVKGKMSIEDIGAYISPDISKLGIYEYIQEPTKPSFRTGLFLIGLLIIIIASLIIYILLQEWYKKNYENSLFKNRNDLFNLINFIYNSRVSGLKDKDIRRKLDSAGWSGEQITYALKKIDGKRTGMWEIPIMGAFERGKVKKEIEKMHPEGVDTRFINQPNF